MSIIENLPLTLSETLSALLTSVIDAQAQAARSTVEFIQDVGTVDGTLDSTTAASLRQVKFRFRKFDEDFENKEFELEVPLLSMVEIPLITVKSAEFSFNYRITQTSKPDDADTGSSGSGTGSTPGAVAISPALANAAFAKLAAKPAVITGKFEKKNPEKTTSQVVGGLDVKIVLEQAPPPVGIERILDMLELAASENEVPE